MTAPVQPSLEKLTRVLELERRQGCEDRAVEGGLERFLARWRDDLPRDVPDGVVHGVLSRLASYRDLAPETRRVRLDAALRSVREARAGGRGRKGGERRGPSGRHGGGTGRGRRREPRPRPDFPVRAVDDPALDGPVTATRGIGAKASDKLAGMGVTTVRGLLTHFPRTYRDFSLVVPIGRLEPGRDVTIVGTVVGVEATRGRRGRHVLGILLEDMTGRIRLTFFNQPYLEKRFAKGRTVAASGRMERWNGRPVMHHPEWEPVGRGKIHTGRLLPIYPTTEGVSQRWLRRHIGNAVEQWAPRVGDPLPGSLRELEGLLSRPAAIWAVHRPHDPGDLAAGRLRLAFDELLGLQLWARQRRRRRALRGAPNLARGMESVTEFLDGLPFDLTGDQRRALDDIVTDLRSGVPMCRLLQGDVGSGKTVVAIAGCVMCERAGHQAAVMAPTEILADQHFRSIGSMLEPLGWRRFRPDDEGDRTDLEPEDGSRSRDEDGSASTASGGPVFARLVGSMSAGAKDAVRAGLASGHIDLVVGTHALIQEATQFRRLALAVVDEQHRFGVLQRAELLTSPGDALDDEPRPDIHQLVMTATPIPRTLAHALNADLDQSVIQELPPGRQPVETLWLQPSERERAYGYIRHRVAQGEQAYIIFPLVEESDQIDARAAVEEYERLDRDVFPGISMALVHGRMSGAEKGEAMSAFHRNEASILVATTVVEVGVDVPNASVMLIDGAERFGLAQLHQLRGRIGRGDVQSACLLLTNDPTASAVRRMKVLTSKVRDPETGTLRPLTGLELAERDLELRGPGDYFGTLQSGEADRFRFARLDAREALERAARVAEAVLDLDPELERTEHAGLRSMMAPFVEGAARK